MRNLLANLARNRGNVIGLRWRIHNLSLEGRQPDVVIFFSKNPHVKECYFSQDLREPKINKFSPNFTPSLCHQIFSSLCATSLYNESHLLLCFTVWRFIRRKLHRSLVYVTNVSVMKEGFRSVCRICEHVPYQISSLVSDGSRMWHCTIPKEFHKYLGFVWHCATLKKSKWFATEKWWFFKGSHFWK